MQVDKRTRHLIHVQGSGRENNQQKNVIEEGTDVMFRLNMVVE